MSDTYRRGAHTVFEIHLHLVWVTKYRRAVLCGNVRTRVRELIREICAQEDVVIFKGYVAKDHVHLSPPYRWEALAELCSEPGLSVRYLKPPPLGSGASTLFSIQLVLGA
jgi:hypothetical protein